MSRKWLLISGVALWAAAAAGGTGWLWAYQARPGEDAAAPAAWPDGSGLRLDSRGPTLVLFLHPRCPCSTATAGELARLAADCGGKLPVRAVFAAPADATDDWARTALWDDFGRIPGVTRHPDPGGTEAARFGAATSGRALLYDPSGRLLFAGGLTAGRGHEGDNAGRRAVADLFRRHGRPPADGSPTAVVRGVAYGCPLVRPAAPPSAPSLRCHGRMTRADAPRPRTDAAGR